MAEAPLIQPISEEVDPATLRTVPQDTVPIQQGGQAVPSFQVDPELRARELAELDRQRQAEQEQIGILQQKKEAMAPGVQALHTQLDQPHPQLRQEAIPEAPNTHAEDAAAYQKYFPAMLIFAAVLSKVGRADMTTGLNMLSQGIVGLKMGRDEVANRSLEQWKMKMEQVKEKNASLLAQYKATMEDRSLSMQEQQMRLSLTAAQYGDDMMIAQLKQQGSIGAVQQIQKMEQMDQKFDTQNRLMESAVMRMQSAAEVLKARKEALDETIASRERIAREGMASREKIASQRQKNIEARKSAKEKDALKNLKQSMSDIDNLISQVQAHPGVTGAYGYANRVVEMISGYTGKTVPGDNPATRFRTAMIMLQAHLTKAAYAGRISNFEIKRMEEAIGGISIEDSPKQVESKLREVKDILSTHVQLMEEETEPFFDSPEEVSEAVKRGEIKVGDTVQTPWGAYKAK